MPQLGITAVTPPPRYGHLHRRNAGSNFVECSILRVSSHRSLTVCCSVLQTLLRHRCKFGTKPWYQSRGGWTGIFATASARASSLCGGGRHRPRLGGSHEMARIRLPAAAIAVFAIFAGLYY